MADRLVTPEMERIARIAERLRESRSVAQKLTLEVAALRSSEAELRTRYEAIMSSRSWRALGRVQRLYEAMLKWMSRLRQAVSLN